MPDLFCMKTQPVIHQKLCERQSFPFLKCRKTAFIQWTPLVFMSTQLSYVFLLSFFNYYYHFLRYCKGGKQYFNFFFIKRWYLFIPRKYHKCTESSFECNSLKAPLKIAKCEQHKPTRQSERATTTTTGEQAAASPTDPRPVFCSTAEGSVTCSTFTLWM